MLYVPEKQNVPWNRVTMSDNNVFQQTHIYTLSTCFQRPVYCEKGNFERKTNQEVTAMNVQVLDESTRLPTVISEIVSSYIPIGH